MTCPCGMGWIPNDPDARDGAFTAASGLGDAADYGPSLRGWVHEIYDQGRSGSCVAQFYKLGVQIREAIRGLPYVPVSAYFLYALARLQGGPVLEDRGSVPRLAAQAMRKFGMVDLARWPETARNLNRHPTLTVAMQAVQRRLGRYERIPTDTGETGALIRRAIHRGLPVGAGLWIGAEWFGATPGQVLDRPQASVGGHMITLVGYRPDGLYEFANSWGKRWADRGFGLLAPSYVERYAMDITVFDGWKRIAA